MTFLIAEVGCNHNGSAAQAKRLTDAAKDAGADAAKFQFFSSVKLWGDDRIKHLELTHDEMAALAEYCGDIGIEFMCTPFGLDELAFLRPMLKRVKIASGCIGRPALLKAAKATGLPIIMSTGMSDLADVMIALDILRTPVTLLQCTSAYPCRLEDVNLHAMNALRALSGVREVGFSDHTSGITASIAAVALGATVIEKHLTLDRNADGPDHKASITPLEMRALRMALVEVEAALGDGVKQVMECEVKLREAWHG